MGVMLRWVKLLAGMDVKAPEAELQIRFDDGYPTAAEREAILRDLRQTGLPLDILSERPAPQGGAGGGGVVLPVDLILQHGSAVLDGLIGAGIWVLLGNAFRGSSKLFAAIQLRIAARRYWRKPLEEGEGPPPVVTYEIPIVEARGFDQEYFDRIPEDYKTIVRLTTELRHGGPNGEWTTGQIEITRFRFKLDWLKGDQPGG